MNSKFKTILLGALVAAPLVISAGPVLARDDSRHDDRGRSGWNSRHDDHGRTDRWRDTRNDRQDLRHDDHARSDRWRDTRNDRRDLRHDYAELARAKRQREDLERSHASRGRIAQEDDHIRSIWDDIRGDRRD